MKKFLISSYIDNRTENRGSKKDNDIVFFLRWMDACPCEVRGRHPEAFLRVRILTPQGQAIGYEVETLPFLDYPKT